MSGGMFNINNELDSAKRLAKNGIEYWMARDIQIILGYIDWESIARVIKKAKKACESAGSDPSNQFLETKKLVEIGSGAQRECADYYLSRYACYLVAMNGDTRKPEIGIAQVYFAVQTRRAEIQDKLTETEKRISLRNRVKDANKNLNKVAKSAGIQSYGLFHDAGYRGLYGMGLSNLKMYKGFDQKEDLLDRAGRAELAANEFRITQCEEKLAKENIKGQQKAMYIHKTVGEEVRKTIQEIGGTMPENLPPEPSLKMLTKKKKTKKLKDKN